MTSKIYRSKKGFTLLELMIVFTIMIIVMGTVYPFFASNFKSLSISEIQSDLQEEGQQAIYNITKNTVGSTGIGDIVKVGNSSVNLQQSTDSVSIKSIQFNKDTIKNTFQLDGTTLGYIYSDTSTYPKQVVSNYIKGIVVTPIPQGTTYSECKGVNISIDLEKRGISYTLNSNIYFRNADTR